MIGDVGPYANDEGDIWVPRIVSYLKARTIAKEALWDGAWVKLTYEGKSDVTLYGFVNDCWCDSGCTLEDEESGLYDAEREGECRVPAWHFRQEER